MDSEMSWNLGELSEAESFTKQHKVQLEACTSSVSQGYTGDNAL